MLGHVAAAKKAAPGLPSSISAVKRVANESNKARRGACMHL